MSILNLPTLSRTAPSFMTFSLIPNTQSLESPLNKSVQTGELPGARWTATFGWNNLAATDARILKAWLNKLSGMAGSFYLYDSSHQAPSGTALGDPLVKGAGQTGRTLLTDGWTANQANLFMPGDYFGVGSQLCVITDLISSNSSGEATLFFEAPLRFSPTDNLAVIITRPTCTMMLKDDNQDSFQFEPGANVPAVTIQCMERF